MYNSEKEEGVNEKEVTLDTGKYAKCAVAIILFCWIAAAKADDFQQDVTGYINAEEKSLREKPENGADWHRLSELYFKQGKYDSSQIAAKKAILTAGKPDIAARSHFVVGRCMEQKGKYGRAKSHYKKSLSILPDDSMSIQALETLKFRRALVSRAKEGKIREIVRDKDNLFVLTLTDAKSPIKNDLTKHGVLLLSLHNITSRKPIHFSTIALGTTFSPDFYEVKLMDVTGNGQNEFLFITPVGAHAKQLIVVRAARDGLERIPVSNSWDCIVSTLPSIEFVDKDNDGAIEIVVKDRDYGDSSNNATVTTIFKFRDGSFYISEVNRDNRQKGTEQ